MKIEWLVFFYMAVSISMALFDLGFLVYEKVHTKRFAERTARLSEHLAHEIDRNADFPTPEHMQAIEHQLHSVSGLESFDLSMEHLCELGQERAERYLRGITEVFDKLTFHYATQDDLDRAYFAYVVRRWYRAEPASNAMDETLLRIVREGSLYARQNALEALAQVGGAETFARAVASINMSDQFHHPKLVTEAAMAFKGDKEQLARELMQRFDDLSAEHQASVVNYLRMVHLGDPTRFLALMQQEGADREVRLACMRYFMTNPRPEAADPIRRFASSDDTGAWEFASVAASVLVAYPGAETTAVLRDCLSSPTYYVRHNAAKSLYDLGATLDGDLADVMAGPDRYAREMLEYRWKLEEDQKEAAS